MLSTRLLMSASSLCLAGAGVALLFAPAELLGFLGFAGGNPILGQLIGTLYLAFAAANWTARGSMIGGIYARPISVANYIHFFVGALILARGLSADQRDWPYVLVLGVYIVFGVLFLMLAFGRLGGARRRRKGA